MHDGRFRRGACTQIAYLWPSSVPTGLPLAITQSRLSLRGRSVLSLTQGFVAAQCLSSADREACFFTHPGKVSGRHSCFESCYPSRLVMKSWIALIDSSKLCEGGNNNEFGEQGHAHKPEMTPSFKNACSVYPAWQSGQRDSYGNGAFNSASLCSASTAVSNISLRNGHTPISSLIPIKHPPLGDEKISSVGPSSGFPSCLSKFIKRPRHKYCSAGTHAIPYDRRGRCSYVAASPELIVATWRQGDDACTLPALAEGMGGSNVPHPADVKDGLNRSQTTRHAVPFRFFDRHDVGDLASFFQMTSHRNQTTHCTRENQSRLSLRESSVAHRQTSGEHVLSPTMARVSESGFRKRPPSP